MMKRIVAAGVGAVMALTLAGCSDPNRSYIGERREEGLSNQVHKVCKNDLAFAVYAYQDAGGITRVPEWDVDC